MQHTQLLSVSPLRWVDEGGLPRATNDAYRPTVAEPTPPQPPAPHPGDAFHAHMLACQQCGEHRFHLCEDGQVLYATMLRDWPGAELGQDKFQRATAAQSAVEAWYVNRFYAKR